MNKIIKNFVAVISIAGAQYALNAEMTPPNWQQNAQLIIDQANTMRIELESNGVLYDTLRNAINIVRDGFVQSDLQRSTTFASLEQRFAQLSQQFAQCVTDKNALIAQTDYQKAQLTSQLMLLNQNANDEIARLLTSRNDLLNQISILNDAYNAMTGGTREQADGIVATLNGFVNAFTSTIAKQYSLVADINNLLSFIEVDNLQTHVENQELENHIVNASN